MTERQKDLPFAEAEGSRAERRNLLGLALLRGAADCQLSVFVQWVFNATAGGADGELIRSYQDLAARPWGLCCSASKARSTVGRARQLGLVRLAENRYTSGGQRANGYSIDWDGVRRRLGFEPHPRSDEVRSKPQPEEVRPGALTEQGGVSTRHPYKEHSHLASSLQLPEPVPEAAAEAEKIFLEIPVLAATVNRPVRPLPAGGNFPCGIFPSLTERHLRSEPTLVQWFRLQLSTARPVCRANQAELLLVLAAARHALAIPADHVRKNRVAAFVGIVSHNRWQRVLTQLPAAVKRLDELLGRFGRDLLEGDTWPPGQGPGARDEGRAIPTTNH